MENENTNNSICNVVMKKPTFAVLLVAIVSIASISSFFAGSYITDENMQFDINSEISKLESQTKDNPVVAEIDGIETTLTLVES